MKNLKGLSDLIRPPQIGPASEWKGPTVKDVLVDSILHIECANGADSIRYRRLGEKIWEGGSDQKLEDAEFELLKGAVNKNPKKYLAWVHGFVMERFLEWERDGEA